MPAPKNNKNASKSKEDILILAKAYIEHITQGYSKEAFVDCDYRTIEKYLKDDIDLQPLKTEVAKANRASLKYWETIGMQLSKGDIRGNPATWIFTIKNKFPELYREKQEIEHTGTETPIIVFKDFANE